jgi:prophage regulatory protein
VPSILASLGGAIMDDKTQDWFLRLPQVLEIIPVSKTTWWSGIKSGRFPPGIKLTPRTTMWLASDIYALVEAHKKNR